MTFWKRKTTGKTENCTFYSVIIASGVGAGLISLLIGIRQSVWFDEAYSIMVAKRPLGELIHLTQLDVHPPLYYILLKIWASVFGWGEVALRSLSALALVAAIIVAGLLLRRLFTARIALYATPLIALAPLLLRYGFEIRMYAIGSLIGVIATYLLVRAVQSKNTAKRHWLIAYAITIAFGLYVQYFLIFLWAAHAIWLAVTNRHTKHFLRTMRPYIYAYVAGALLFLPWLPIFIRQLTNGALASIGSPLNFEQLMSMLTFNTIYVPIYQVTMLATFVLVALTTILIYTAIKFRKDTRKYTSSWLLLVSYIGVPAILVMLMSFFMSPYTERYLSHVAIGLIMLIASLSAFYLTSNKIRLRAKIIAGIIVYGCFLIGVIQLIGTGNFNFQRWQKPQMNHAAASIKDCGDGAQLVAAGPYEAIELTYYLPQCDIYFVSSSERLLGGYAPLDGSKLQLKNLDSITAQHIIFVHYDNAPSSLPPNYNVASTQTFNDVRVSQLQHK